MNENTSPHAFILGCERSGSTWLSNVLDAHPGIEFFMEPFADYADLFPGLPSRNIHLNHENDALAKVVSEDWEHLQRVKYTLFYNRKRNLYWKKIDRLVISGLQIIGLSKRIKQFQLLNMNLNNVPIKWQSKKTAMPTLTVTKELRLNFKVGLIQRVFPQAKFIIIARHPGAQVASIMKLFQRGHLGELRKSLHSLYGDLRKSKYKVKYLAYFKELGGDPDMRELLLLWWLINYETLIEDCKRYGVDYKVVFNEDLSTYPAEHYQEILSFIGLDFHPAVRAYLAHSTVDSQRRDNNSVISPVDTIRDSSRYSKEAISNLDNEMGFSIANLYSRFNICTELSRYWKHL